MKTFAIVFVVLASISSASANPLDYVRKQAERAKAALEEAARRVIPGSSDNNPNQRDQSSTQTGKEPKAWELKNWVPRNVVGFGVSVGPDGTAGAPAGSFGISVRRGQYGMLATFLGECAEITAVKQVSVDPRDLDIERFKASAITRSETLGPTLQILREELERQCEQLQVIRLTYEGSYHDGGHRKTYSYQATLMRSQQWAFVDGAVKTEFDRNMRIEVGLMDRGIGVAHRGLCEASPTLLIEPMFANRDERAFLPEPTMGRIGNMAKAAAARYAQHCPGTTEIHFAIKLLPSNYGCTAEADCFVVAAATGNEWRINDSQISYREPSNPPITGISDISEVLAAGRLDLLKNYPDYFNFYFESFLRGYSKRCEKYIKDPVKKIFNLVQTTTSSNGVEKKEVIVSDEFTVERQYVDELTRRYRSWYLWAMTRIIGRSGTVVSTLDAATSFGNEAAALEQSFPHLCTDARLQAIYANLIVHAMGGEPIVGQFATNKRAIEPSQQRVASAPLFVAKYEAARAGGASQQSSPTALPATGTKRR